MSMMNANAAATTAMTANEPLDFELPEISSLDVPLFLFTILLLPSFFRWE